MVAELQSSCGRIGLREMDEKEGVLARLLEKTQAATLTWRRAVKSRKVREQERQERRGVEVRTCNQAPGRR